MSIIESFTIFYLTQKKGTIIESFRNYGNFRVLTLLARKCKSVSCAWSSDLAGRFCTFVDMRDQTYRTNEYEPHGSSVGRRLRFTKYDSDDKESLQKVRHGTPVLQRGAVRCERRRRRYKSRLAEPKEESRKPRLRPKERLRRLWRPDSQAGRQIERMVSDDAK